MVAFPEAFTFNCYLQGLSFHHFFIRMYEILDSTTIPALTSWVVPSDISVEETQGNLDELKEYVSNLPVVHDAELWFGPSLHFFGYEPLEVRKKNVTTHNEKYEFSYSFHVGEETNKSPEQVASFFSQIALMMRFLSSQSDLTLRRIEFLREGGTLRCLAMPPLAETSPFALVTESMVRNSYEEPEVFWQSWDTIERFGEQFFLTRGLNYPKSPDFLSHILDNNWAMARVAKAGLTKYSFLRPTEEEKPIVKKNSSKLSARDYVEEEDILLYQCHLEKDEHLPGWEILELCDVRFELPGADGESPINIGIVFSNESSAQREKRPLHDLNIKVYFEKMGVIIPVR